MKTDTKVVVQNRVFVAASTSPRLWSELLIAFALFLPSYLVFRNAMSGDGAIYFTFIKNFWSLPFSYQPDTVSFGATSPLYVVFHAIVSAVAVGDWLEICKLVNFALIPIGVVLLNRALRGGLPTLLLLATAVILSPLLMTITGQLFESGLSFFCVSLVYYLLKRQSHRAAILFAGSLYLVRPELALVTIAVDLYIIAKSPRSELFNYLLLSLIALIPSAVYHGFMFYHTGELLPSSIVGRAVRAAADTTSRFQSLRLAVAPLFGWQGAIFLLAAPALVVLLLPDGLKRHWPEVLLFLPLPLLFLVRPPGAALARYLLPVLPIAAAITVEAAVNLSMWGARRSARMRRSDGSLIIRALAVAALLLAVIAQTIIYPRVWPQRYDHDTLLLKDLADSLNPVCDSDDRVLIYEIQSQYHLQAHCVSLDAIVGSQMLRFLAGKESLSEAVRREQIDYVVTMNSFNYRSSFKNTPLQDLYLHDLASRVGDSLDVDGLRFTKIFTNQVFAEPGRYHLVPWAGLNTGDSLRVYGDFNPLWAGHHPMWNSVYRIQPLAQIS